MASRPLQEIIVHCSATRPSQDIGAAEIRKWHLERGFNDIGYHYVIRRDGTVEKGRALNVVGAHCKGHNAYSIGICLVGGIPEKAENANVGEVNYTDAQYHALKDLITMLRVTYPSIMKLSSHCEYANKFCPGFFAREWFETCSV